MGRYLFGFSLAAFLQQQEGRIRIQHGHAFDAMIAIMSIMAPPTLRIFLRTPQGTDPTRTCNGSSPPQGGGVNVIVPECG